MKYICYPGLLVRAIIVLYSVVSHIRSGFDFLVGPIDRLATTYLQAYALVHTMVPDVLPDSNQYLLGMCFKYPTRIDAYRQPKSVEERR